MQSKNKSDIVIQKKIRETKKKTKAKNILKQKANKTKTESKNQKLTWETDSFF